MKKIFTFIILFAMIFQPGLGVLSSTAAKGSQPVEPGNLKAPAASEGPGMPGWPTPDKPVPHNQPGHLSNANHYTSQVEVTDEKGAIETVPLSGLDAMAADGIDPLAGNYTLVSQDQVLRGGYSNNSLNLETLAITPTITTLPGSQQNLGNYLYNDLAAGDLNGDGQSEHVAAWVGAQNHIYLSTGEMPGMPGKTTSAPAVVARGGASPAGYALSFDGVDDYVDAGSGINLANTSFTVAFWAKRNSIDRNDFAVGHGVWGSSNTGLHIGFRDNNAFTCDFYSNGLNTPEVYADTDWHHWACTYDAGTRLRTIYRDGIQVAQDFATANYQGSGDLYIGNGPTGTVLNFYGLIDEVGVWSVARTADRIQADMIRVEPDQTGLIAYWPFNEGSGTTTADASGDGHVGTLVNGPLWNPENAPLGDFHLLVRGYDQALWDCIYDVDSDRCLSWNNSAGGVLLSAPAVVSLGDGQFDAFVIGTDNQVYRRHWEGGWSGDWQQYGVWPSAAPSWSGPAPELPAPAAVARGGGIDLFRLGPDNTLYWHNGTGWGSLGGMLASAPGAVSLSANHMQVFARGVDEALWSLAYNNSWGQWQRLPMTGLSAGVTIASPPAAVSPAAGQIAVYVRGSDGQLWTVQGNGSSWSAWSAGGGELASGPGAAAWSGTTYLFAQTMDGLLQSSQDGVTWVDLGGLRPCCTVQFAGIGGAPVYIDEYQDFSLDIESGYFLGDGRSQIALAYFSGASQVSIAVYEMGGGGLNIVTNTLVLPQAIDYFSMATGDFLDADGIDEIALAYSRGNAYNLQFIKVARTGLSVEVTGTAETAPTNNFSGTFSITAGDFDGDGQDEIGLITVWHESDWMYALTCYSWIFHFRMRVYDLLGTSLKTYRVENDWVAEAMKKGYDAQIIGNAFAAGDVNGDGRDELVRTWPDHFGSYADSCWTSDQAVVFRFNRNLQVLELPGNSDVHTNTWDANNDGIIDNLDIKTVAKLTPVDESRSYKERLVVGDLNRDLKGEIAWQMTDDHNNEQLRTYYYAPSLDPTQPYQPYAENKPLSSTMYPKLVMGAFTGESVRVGPPSYRVQNRVDTLVATINMPPKQRDLVKDSAGNYQLIESPSEESCKPSIDRPNCTHAKYATKDFTSSEQTIQTVHAFSLSAGMEQKACAGGGIGVVSLNACVTNSINTTHGANFEKTTDTISSITFNRQVIAADDDQLVYFGTPYAVWEYPILTDQTGQSDGFITVAFPLTTQTKVPNVLGGYYNGTCDENLYAPGHQVDNVWSYDSIGDPLTYKDYDPNYVPIYSSIVGDFSSDAITYQDFTKVADSNTYKHALSVGREVEVKAEAKIEVVNLEGSFKASFNGSYENTHMQSDIFTTKNDTTYSYFIGPQPQNLKFQTRVVFYWAKDGYQELNYQTLMGTAWDQVYYKADPAFILPWYGFPDPNAPQPPPCGVDQQRFSPDLQVDPAYASVGDTVAITATVRNFSNKAPNQPVTVRFYQGDPGKNVVIGEDTIQNLNRQDGPRTAHITWTASGTGKQKIYAVIDPDNNINEMHDTGDLIDNNFAYVQLEIGAAAFVDMGATAKQPYQSQSYRQGADTRVSFYLPPANLEAVSRFDLEDSLQMVSNAVGKPFELVAFQGSQTNMWDKSLPNFDLRPSDGSPPAVITVAYSDASITGMNEADLRLYRLTNLGWELANLTCGLSSTGQPSYEVQRFPQDNLIAVPVCQTGTFVLTAGAPTGPVYLPLMFRR